MEQYFGQYRQDEYFDKEIFHGKRDGVFVEVGADDGVVFSNTLFFEKYRSWKGVCIEPRKSAYRQLLKNRHCWCENVAISQLSGQQRFLNIRGQAAQLSGLVGHYDPRHLARINLETQASPKSKKLVKIPSLSLSKVLAKHNLTHVDFCSIDTEGSELDILKSVDFNKLTIDYFVIENNYHTTKIKNFLEKRGYRLIKKFKIDEVYQYKKINHSQRFLTKIPALFTSRLKTKKTFGEDYLAQKQLLALIASPLIFDVGANRGQTTEKYLRLFATPEIHGFEPYEPSFRLYQENFKDKPNVYPNLLSLGSKRGRALFYFNSCNYTNSLLKPLPPRKRHFPEVDKQMTPLGKSLVPTTTLDSYTAENKIAHIDILKLDTQGSELLVLKGASKLLKKKLISLIFCEVEFIPLYEKQALFSDIESYLRPLGYPLFALYNLYHSQEGKLVSADALFYKQA